MKDRFTAILLVVVAFVGGLLAMVVVARWQADKPTAPESGPTTVAQAAVEPRPEVAALEQSPPATAVGSARGDEAGAHETVAERGLEPGGTEAPPAAVPQAGRTPPSVESSGDRGATTAGEARERSRPEQERRPAAPDVEMMIPAPSNQGSGSAVSRNPERFGGTKSTLNTASPPQAYLNDPTQTGDRALGRPQAPGSGNATSDAAGGADTDPGAAQESGPYDPPDLQDDPQTDPPIVDDPFDEPEPEPEPIPPALVKAYPTTGTFAVGSIAPVLVEIQSGTDVGHVPFHLAYDPRVLRFDHGEEGEFLRVDGSPTVFFATTAGSGDSVVVGLSRLGHGPGIDGAGSLCVLYFEAVGPGTTQLRFKLASVKDSGNGRLPAVFDAGAVSVTVGP